MSSSSDLVPVFPRSVAVVVVVVFWFFFLLFGILFGSIMIIIRTILSYMISETRQQNMLASFASFAAFASFGWKFFVRRHQIVSFQCPAEIL